MCGIVGSYQLDTGKPATGDRIDAALHCIAHRGPDDEGRYSAGRAVLGHRRLSILDTSAAGHQPFTDEGGRYTMVYNGEVFNFAELRSQLEDAGHHFRSGTDTEVVLRLFLVKGASFLDDLNGFFALAIHDAQDDSMFLARDRSGIKPLLWCVTDGRLLFSSELRGLLALGAPVIRDEASLHQCFKFHYISAPHTILQGVNKLEPGHLMTVGPEGVKVSAWYDLPAAARQAPTSNAPARHLHDLLDDAVRLRLVSDVPVGTFLSGGLDSSIISALAARHHRDLHTFSIGYADDPYFDESSFAAQVADHIGSTHHAFRLTRNDLAEGYLRFLEAIDEPFADSSALASFLLCERTREHVTVALSGDGADEIFGGYRKHQAELLLRDPGVLGRTVIALAPLWRTLPRSRNGRIPDMIRRMHRFAEAGRGSAEDRWLSLAALDGDGDTAHLLPSVQRPVEREAHMARGLRLMPGMDGALLTDVLTVLSHDMLYKVDLTSMAHGLEVRPPFLDHRVMVYAFSLKADRKFSRGKGKAILHEAFGPILPPAILARRKQGFEVPLLDLLKGPLAGLVERTLRKDAVEASGLHWPAVQAVRERLVSASPGQAQATVHALLVYLSWWRSNGA